MLGLNHAANMVRGAVRSLAGWALKDHALAAYLGNSFLTDAGIAITDKTAIGYAPLWRGINLIAGDIASLPLNVYERTGEDARRKAKEHPAHDLLRWRANPEVTAYNFRKTMQAHALLRGNGYAWIERAANGDPIALWPMDPDKVRVARETDESAGRSVLMYIYMERGGGRRLAYDDVLHIRGLGGDGIVGYDVLTYHRETLAPGIAARMYGAYYFRNDARPNVVLKIMGQRITKEQEDAIRIAWNNGNMGLGNQHKTAVLPSGIDITMLDTGGAKNAQLVESRQFEIREAANMLGLPPHKLGDSARTAYNSLEQENQSYLDDCLNPWLVQWETECGQKLLTERQQQDDTHYVEFNRGALVRVDHKTSIETAVMQVNNGLLTVNEARAMQNRPPVDGGDVPRRPANIMTEGQSDAQAQGAESGQSLQPSPEAISSARQNVAQVLRAMWGRVAQHMRKARRGTEENGFAAAVAAVDEQHSVAFRGKVACAHRVSAALVGGWPIERLSQEFFDCVRAGLATLGDKPDDTALEAWEATGEDVIARIVAEAIGNG